MSGNWILDRNPPYPLILRLFLFFVAFLILLLGVRLVWEPVEAFTWWPWVITPFDAGFLGSFSLAELSAILVFLVATRWAPGRLVVPSWFTFTALVGLLSILTILGLGAAAVYLALNARLQTHSTNDIRAGIWLICFIIYGAAGFLLIWKTFVKGRTTESGSMPTSTP